MSKFGKELIESLTEAADHAKGNQGNVRVHVVEVPDVRAIRRQLRMSQQEFARTYRIPLATVKNWEQGRRQPDASTAAYLRSIAEMRLEENQKAKGFQLIGEFIFWFSQLEFTIKARLSAALGLDDDFFGFVTAPYDFAVLCTVTGKVLEHRHPAKKTKIKKLLSECRMLNDERVRIAHGLWTHGNGNLVARHASRQTLEAKFFYNDPQALVQVTQTAKQLMLRILAAPDEPIKSGPVERIGIEVLMDDERDGQNTSPNPRSS